jgi:hypothetical protein
MDFDPDMVRDEPDDPFGVSGPDMAAGIFQSTSQPVDPQPAVGVEHDFDDARIFEIAGDRGSERGAQHPRAAREGLGSSLNCPHGEPHEIA